MKEKTAKIIRIITIPPIEALAMLLILYKLKREEFGTTGNLLMAILFLTVIPICSYPIASRKKDKEDHRNNQRKMAFAFNFLSYLAAMAAGYCAGCTGMLQWIFNGYFLAVLVLTIVNKVFKIKAKDIKVLLAALLILAAGGLARLYLKGSVIEWIEKQNLLFRWMVYLGAFFAIMTYGCYGSGYNAQDFIYAGF